VERSTRQYTNQAGENAFPAPGLQLRKKMLHRSIFLRAFIDPTQNRRLAWTATKQSKSR
jgi:hypothetical protein